MDLLSDLFRQAGLRGRVLDLRPLSPGVALRFPCERSLGVHAVLQGTVWLHTPSLQAPQRLEAGDIALMARGCVHWLAASPSLAGLVQLSAVPSPPDAGPGLPTHDGPADDAPTDAPPDAPRVISGAYQLWNPPVHPFFDQLPAWVLMRHDEVPRLGPLALALGLLQQEAPRTSPGADTIVHGLLDAVFGYLLREVLQRQRQAGIGWGHAMGDPAIARVVAAMQAEPARAWTLDALARHAGLSRTALAERFRRAMNDTPLNHLRTLRVQRALHLLSESGDPLERVAQAVGYTDAFSFSKVFKRVTGLAPAEFRRRDAAERQLPWRFAGAAGA